MKLPETNKRTGKKKLTQRPFTSQCSLCAIKYNQSTISFGNKNNSLVPSSLATPSKKLFFSLARLLLPFFFFFFVLCVIRFWLGKINSQVLRSMDAQLCHAVSFIVHFSSFIWFNLCYHRMNGKHTRYQWT